LSLIGWLINKSKSGLRLYLGLLKGDSRCLNFILWQSRNVLKRLLYSKHRKEASFDFLRLFYQWLISFLFLDSMLLLLL
jgi:hypothetical protein